MHGRPSRVSGGLGQVRGPQSKMENAGSGEFVTYVGYAPVRLICKILWVLRYSAAGWQLCVGFQ